MPNIGSRIGRRVLPNTTSSYPRLRRFLAATMSGPESFPTTPETSVLTIRAADHLVLRVGGEVWTVSGGGPYAGNTRPAVIVQEDRFDSTNTITLCVFTTDPTEAPLLRTLIEPTDRNGLSSASRLMVDKVTTVPKARLGKRIGKLNDEDVLRLNRALTVFLGLAR